MTSPSLLFNSTSASSAAGEEGSNTDVVIRERVRDDDETKKNINDETSKGATLNFYLITFTVLLISLVWALTITFLSGSGINS